MGDLDTSISAYEKGFYIKNDYYNGINLSFLHNLRASITSGPEAIADAVIAQRVRRRVLQICSGLVSPGASMRAEEHYWVLATVAEAWTGLGDDAKAEEAFEAAKALKPADWMTASTQEQLVRLRELLRPRQ